MKPSQVAKDLGFTVAELVWFARKHGFALESTKADIPPRIKAQLIAGLPNKKVLKADNPDLLDEIKAGAAEIKTAEAASKPKTTRKLAATKAPAKPRTARVKKAKEPKAPVPEKPKAAPPKPAVAKKAATKRKVKEIKLSEIDTLVGGKKKAAGDKAAAAEAKPKERPKIEEERVRAEEEERRKHKPLIDLTVQKEEIRAIRADEPRSDTRGPRSARPIRAPGGPRRSGGPPGRLTRKHPRPPRAILEAMRPRKPARPPSEREVSLSVPISIKELSQEIGIKSGQLIRKLMEHGMMATINTALDRDAVEMMGLEFNRRIKIREKEILEEKVIVSHEDKPEDLKPRPPVVTILGHVDHGKTTLLDKIRKSNVAEKEAGGITQSIAAYRVKTTKGEIIFVDTPGHQAFTAMRARGANITDVVVLVVAADDGVMPQTEESISHAKAAKVPIVVAINKIDKQDANVHRAKQQLAQKDLNPEEWGGDTLMSEVSALTGKGIPEFLEQLALQTEIQDLKANPDRAADGTVLEVLKSDSRGVVATLLIQGGTLRKGDVLICGSSYGRVRSIHDDRGNEITEAGPASPVQITGLDDVAEVGARFSAVSDIKSARKLAEERKSDIREKGLQEKQQVTLENIFDTIERGKAKELNVVLKTDVKGSMEVLAQSLKALSIKELRLNLIHSGVGTINHSDVDLAIASNGVIIGFNVGVEPRAASLAEEKNVQVRRHAVIYTLLEEVQAALEGLLEPEEVETVIGRLHIKEVFKTSRGNVAGCMVSHGKVERSARVRVLREGKKLFIGRISSLRRFKDDVRDVAEGMECGLKIDGFEGIRKDDLIEAFTVEKVPRKVYQRS